MENMKTENNRLDLKKYFINPDAFVLCGISKSEIPRIEIVRVIKQTVSDFTEIAWPMIILKTRNREFVEARQLAHFFLKKYTKMSLREIGLYVGGKDHATVLHSNRVINNLRDTDRLKKDFIDRVDGVIKNKIALLGNTFVKLKKLDTIADWQRVKHMYIK